MVRGSRVSRAAAGAVAGLWLVLAAGSPAPRPAEQEAMVTAHARGTFEVKMTPLPPLDDAVEGAPGRMRLDKTFQGDLQGTSQGQMLAAITPVEGSAGYVAMERVSGTLHGRAGSFVLQHSGTMTRGAPHLVITVVPDSGTGELEGIAGTMAIDLSGGKHAYDFEYTLPGTP